MVTVRELLPGWARLADLAAGVTFRWHALGALYESRGEGWYDRVGGGCGGPWQCDGRAVLVWVED